MKSLIRNHVKALAFTKGRLVGLYKKLSNPDGTEWAEFLKARNYLYAQGEHCSIQTNVTITDPKYVRLGNNVRLTGCTLFGHDGSVNMINRAFGLNLDQVGKVDIHDNVFVGHGSIILTGVSIGPNAIVAAGSVVSKDVPENSVVGGVPAKIICSLEDMVERMKQRTSELPWLSILNKRQGGFDPVLQKELDKVRIKTFFGQQAE
jgi:hypothetical protein